MKDYDEIKLTVALIVYNHEKYLKQAIESILMQEVNFKYEIIVGEDNSTDNSREILIEYKAKYPDKFVLLFHDENVGGTRNSYDVLVNARGKYIASLEGDDYWIDSRKLQKQVDFLDSNKDYLGVTHVIEARDLKGNFLSEHPKSPKIVGKDATIDLFLQGNYFSAVATVFRNIFQDKSADYSIYYKAHRYVGDLTMCILLLDKGKIKVLSDAMSVYRCRTAVGESNYNSFRKNLEIYNDHIELLNAINLHFNNKYDFAREYIDRSTSALLFCIRHGRYRQFYNAFNKIPVRFKIRFLTNLPYSILRKAFRKYTGTG